MVHEYWHDYSAKDAKTRGLYSRSRLGLEHREIASGSETCAPLAHC